MRAFLFDLDDTLYLRKDPYIRAFRALYAGATIDEDALYARSRRVGEEEFKRCLAGECTKEEMEIQRALRTFTESSLAADRETAERFQALYASEQEKIRILSPLERALKVLCARGVFLGVLTNGSTGHQMKKAEALGLFRYIPRGRILTSGEIGTAKPDPAAWQIYLERHGLAAADTWMIGDSLEADVEGAKTAGLHTVWIPRYGEQAAEGAAEVTVYSDGELARLLTEELTF